MREALRDSQHPLYREMEGHLAAESQEAKTQAMAQIRQHLDQAAPENQFRIDPKRFPVLIKTNGGLMQSRYSGRYFLIESHDLLLALPAPAETDLPVAGPERPRELDPD